LVLPVYNITSFSRFVNGLIFLFTKTGDSAGGPVPSPPGPLSHLTEEKERGRNQETGSLKIKIQASVCIIGLCNSFMAYSLRINRHHNKEPSPFFLFLMGEGAPEAG